ncbi:DUF957 domain-containing protein [Citrobacter freundii]|nr:DUF957 domain-containing protein [Citrobacter freundii]
MSKQHKLEILLAWLEDNVECGTAIEFTDGVDSAAMLPVVRGAVELLAMPKAKRGVPPFSGYYYTEAIPTLEMNRCESDTWNTARDFVIKRLTQEAAQ